ncbi:MAG TPA: 2Fe-2S iron-sulfur cluster-binding protein [Phenylobacterium sp.]|uniref:2Fe-2S iron-sulfur cluster-binding protein n=1 Tax=Phenylobacterium sp. TaxID=1871053 RepID=UPI002B46A2A8|nr:2Fe-2S iron-sulfur cluster-binding protein [Phenylobacterium sp.]HKR86844.1 2Fe-2S iron-sulfur cluster-binding protein [Phenylobacterium sp.]
MSTAFHPLKIVAVDRETDHAIALTLEPPTDWAAQFAFSPGQHLTFRADIGGEDVRRNYSICAAPAEQLLKVAIKQVEGGVFSNWALEALRPGASIEAMPPHGHFTWRFEAGAKRHYVAFAAGSGITPVLSLLKAGLAAEPLSRFTLLYGNRSSSSIMFLEELGALKNRYLDRLEIYHFLTAELDEVELFNGRLDAARIAEVLSSLVDRASIDVAFICGPGPMMDAAEAAMREAGLAPEQILLERFGLDPAASADTSANREAREKAQGLMLEVRMDGRRRRIAFDAEKGSILESARGAGLPAPYACKAGVCATCRAKLVEGQVQMDKTYGLSSEEVAQGYILTCQAVPVGDDVVIDYDA